MSKEKQYKPEIMSTQTTYKQPEQVEVKPSPAGDGEPSQNCGRCGAYVFNKDKGFLCCKVRGGRRKETAGSDCEKFKVKDE